MQKLIENVKYYNIENNKLIKFQTDINKQEVFSEEFFLFKDNAEYREGFSKIGHIPQTGYYTVLYIKN
jgi:hypothetical protein